MKRREMAQSSNDISDLEGGDEPSASSCTPDARFLEDLLQQRSDYDIELEKMSVVDITKCTSPPPLEVWKLQAAQAELWDYDNQQQVDCEREQESVIKKRDIGGPSSSYINQQVEQVDHEEDIASMWDIGQQDVQLDIHPPENISMGGSSDFSTYENFSSATLNLPSILLDDPFDSEPWMDSFENSKWTTEDYTNTGLFLVNDDSSGCFTTDDVTSNLHKSTRIGQEIGSVIHGQPRPLEILYNSVDPEMEKMCAVKRTSQWTSQWVASSSDSQLDNPIMPDATLGSTYHALMKHMEKSQEMDRMNMAARAKTEVAAASSIHNVAGIQTNNRLVRSGNEELNLRDPMVGETQKEGTSMVQLLLVCAEAIACRDSKQAVILLQQLRQQMVIAIGSQANCMDRVISCFVEANSAILEAFEGEDMVHILDLGMTHGLQWPHLIYALSRRPNSPPQLLRITGLGEATQEMEEAGYKLKQYANSQNVKGEVLAINSLLQLHCIIKKSRGSLNSVLKSILKLSPKILTMVEQDVNHNGPLFMGRFTEALHYSAIFESLDVVLPRYSSKRMKMEQFHFAEEIKNIISCEGVARVERHEKLDQWCVRMSHAGFQLVPLPIKFFSQVQVWLAVYSCKSYTLFEENECLILGWKSRPVIVTSSWCYI